MAQWVLELQKPSASFRGAVVAAAPDGGAYVAGIDQSSFQASVLRIAPDGSIVWQKNLTAGTVVTYGCALVASNSGCVLALGGSAGSGATSDVLSLAAADGSIVWNRVVNFRVDSYGPNNYASRRLALTSSGDVVLAGYVGGSTTSHRVAKLDGSTGALVWTFNPRDTASSGYANSGTVAGVLAGGDVVFSFVSGAGNVGSVCRLAAADGSLVWAKTVAFPGAPDALLSTIDPSGNIYLSTYDTASGANTCYVTKLDGSGSVVWKQVVSLTADTDVLAVLGAASADASYVYIGIFQRNAAYNYSRAGVLALSTSGGVQGASTLQNATYAYANGAESLDAYNGYAFFTSSDRVSSVYRATVMKQGVTDLNSATFTPYSRNAVAFSVASDTTTTVTAVTPTLAGTVSDTTSAGAVTSATGTLLYNLYTGGASGISPVGLIRFAYGALPTTRFGTPRNSWSYPATSLAPTAMFGTGLLTYNLITHAIGQLLSARFGEPYAFEFRPSRPVLFAASIAPTTTFGAPTVVATGSFAQRSSGSSILFGVAVARLRQSVTATAPATRFGVAKVLSRFAVAGFVSGRFGTPTLLQVRVASGWASSRFGKPAGLRRLVSGIASGAAPSTRFGTPAVTHSHLAKALLFRPRFGLARVVQACV